MSTRTFPGVSLTAQARITALRRHKVQALVRRSFDDLGRWETRLRAFANQLEHLEIRAKRAVASEVGIEADSLGLPVGRDSQDDGLSG